MTLDEWLMNVVLPEDLWNDDVWLPWFRQVFAEHGPIAGAEVRTLRDRQQVEVGTAGCELVTSDVERTVGQRPRIEVAPNEFSSL